ncbi:5-deoxy-glucuronate isomerase [Clostridiales bacterium COT073_COT-073]|nr:5-deoxy-glucuronate isomerase [Clostridiales bacterium COT073_COT-073]
MSQLLIHPQKNNFPGLQLVQDINIQNSVLRYIGLKVLSFDPGSEYSENLITYEACIVVLEGKINVSTQNKTYYNVGQRQHIFDKLPTDSVYIPVNQGFCLQSITSSKIAICYAVTDNTTKSPVLIPAAKNDVERRGNHHCRRLVHTMLSDNSTISDKLLVTEVYTEGGNWSSYPPHKHDTDNLPHESLLEEIYYHETDKDSGFVIQKVYTDDLSLDETYTVRNHDIVLVPKGYHPVGVPDGYCSYYLNVMAGPIKKWKFHNDPNHEFLLKRR